MEKMINRKSLRLFAENRDHRPGFDIYLGYPGGEREYVRTNRHNGLLYGIMKGGVKVEDLSRWLTGDAKLACVGDRKSRSKSAAHVEGSIRQLLKMLNELVAEKEYDTISLSSLAAKAKMQERSDYEM